MGISIIIVDISKKHSCINDCIWSIEKNCNISNMEIIIVTDDKDNINYKNIKKMSSEGIDGISKAWNLGVEASKKENDIVILDSSVIVSHDFIRNLRRCAYSDNKVAAVAPATNISSYYQFIEGSNSLNDKDKMEEILKKNYESNECEWEERQKIEGYCFFIKRQILNEIKCFDNIYKTLEYAESDFSVNLINNGYKLILCKDTYVYRQTTNKIYDYIYKQLLDVEEKLFKNKWGFKASNKMNIDIGYLNFIKGNNPNIIEVGCGTGATAMYIMNRIDCNYYGINTYESSLSYYKGTKMNVI